MRARATLASVQVTPIIVPSCDSFDLAVRILPDERNYVDLIFNKAACVDPLH